MGVRWTDFTATGNATIGTYWPNDDPLIQETDNFATYYLPHLQWCYLRNLKIIEIATPKAIFRNLSNSSGNASFAESNFVELQQISAGLTFNQWGSNYNPGCLANPTGNFTVTFGGGTQHTQARGTPAQFTVCDSNPDYPTPSNKPLRIRQWTTSGIQPVFMRNVSVLDDWIYWGHCPRRLVDCYTNDTTNDPRPYQYPHEFYRAKLSDMPKGIWTVERLPDIPTTLTPAAFIANQRYKWHSFPVDEVRKRVFLVNTEGAFAYQVPADNSVNGAWYGPFRPEGMTAAQWFTQISQGANWWWGSMAIHRSDLNQTFMRPAYCGSSTTMPKWNRIAWGT